MPSLPALLGPSLLAWPLLALGGAEEEVEPFGSLGFLNPFFQHAFEFPQPNWQIEPVGGGDWELHLQPNTDFVTWTLPPGKVVTEVRCTVRDFESEPFGSGGTSAFLARSSTGDFARFNTVGIGVEETGVLTVDTPGVLTGVPLGDIVQVQLQASNTGGPGGVGAFFDDLTAVLEPTAFTDLGGGLAGVAGVPLLVGTGTLAPGTDLDLTVRHAAPSAPVALVVGTSQADLPLLGGVLVPAPDLVLTSATDGAGTATFAATWPAGAASGTALWYQAWTLDAAAPQGASASNAVGSVSP